MNTEAEQKIRSRRSHRKSRLGCLNCKKRRVKCDEKKPICGSCLQHSISCDFSAPASSPSEGSTPPPRRFAFKQSKYQSLATSQKEKSKEKSKSASVESHDHEPPALRGHSGLRKGDGLSRSDLSLFHHFVISAFRTFADEDMDSHKIWQFHVPQWGMSFPSVMHLLLTLSALHLASLHPESEETYIAQADEHFSFGVRSVTSVLALDTLDSENCQFIYMSAVMICFAYFARGPREGEYLVFNARGKSEWLVLLHGVRSILAQEREAIFTGVLTPKEPDSVGRATCDISDELDEHLTRLREIQNLIMAHVQGPDERDLYIRTVDDLTDSFEQAYERRKHGCHGTELMPATIGWTFRLLDPMIDRLEAREPVALVILAHWAILLRYMREVWFMRGWDGHIIRGIRACLPSEFQAWIEWPGVVIQ
ncbi:putative Zn(II)2Cys6 transcription factor [Aspergillus californicus]